MYECVYIYKKLCVCVCIYIYIYILIGSFFIFDREVSRCSYFLFFFKLLYYTAFFFFFFFVLRLKTTSCAFEAEACAVVF